MSAFGGKADMAIGTCPLSWSLSGVKQTSLVAAHMSACDPKRTFCASLSVYLLATVRYPPIGAGEGQCDDGSSSHFLAVLRQRGQSSDARSNRGRGSAWCPWELTRPIQCSLFRFFSKCANLDISKGITLFLRSALPLETKNSSTSSPPI